MSKVIAVLCTFPNADEAAEVGRALVQERLAACVNLVPQVRSIYRWQDQIHDDAEVLAIIKTPDDGFPALQSRLLQLHPYDCPEVLALPVERGNPDYLDWVRAQVG